MFSRWSQSTSTTSEQVQSRSFVADFFSFFSRLIQHCSLHSLNCRWLSMCSLTVENVWFGRSQTITLTTFVVCVGAYTCKFVRRAHNRTTRHKSHSGAQRFFGNVQCDDRTQVMQWQSAKRISSFHNKQFSVRLLLRQVEKKRRNEKREAIDSSTVCTVSVCSHLWSREWGKLSKRYCI